MNYKEALIRTWFTEDSVIAWLIYVAPFLLTSFTGSSVLFSLLVPVFFFFVLPLFVQWSINDAQKEEKEDNFLNPINFILYVMRENIKIKEKAKK